MRLLHTMLRVGDLDASKRFYCDVLGMKLLRETEYPEGKFTLSFVGYDEESTGAVIELTYNWGTSSYAIGDAFGHIAIGTPDIRATCEKVRAAGGKVTREPGPVKHATARASHGGPETRPTLIAFVEDPTGYKIELIERKEP